MKKREMAKQGEPVKRRKPKAQRKETPLKIMLTAEQHAVLQVAADREGQALSAWVRAAALRSAVPV